MQPLGGICGHGHSLDAKLPEALGQKASCRFFEVDQCSTGSGLSYGRGGSEGGSEGGGEGFFHGRELRMQRKSILACDPALGKTRTG